MALRSGTDSPLLPGARTASASMSYGQQRLWFLHELRGGSLEYHVPEAFWLCGELDLAALRAAIETVVARHDILRTRFPVIGGKPTPVVDQPAPVELAVTDLHDLPDPEREIAVQDALHQEWSQPFDLANGPVLRVRLFRTADLEHLLLLTIHHIASDGWSQGLLFDELRVLYDAYRAGEANPLPPLPIQYADFAAWQQERIDAGALVEDLAYWREQLAGLPELLALPADRLRTVTDTAPGGMCRLVLDNATLTRLHGLARAHGVTLYMLMLAAFTVLLSRHSGQRDVAVGSPIANRNRIELERLIGFFVNTLVLRQDVRPDLRFADLLDNVRRTALDAYAHQDAPFDRVVEELSPDRRLDRNPLIQVMFALNVSTAAPLRLAGLDVTQVEQVGIRARFDLELHAWESTTELTLRWVYDENLFDRWRIEQLARHYLRVLDQVCANPDLPIADIDLLNADERTWLTSRHGAASTGPPAGVGTLFTQQVRRRPDAVALRHNGTVHSYADLDRLASRIAAQLAARGVPTGGTVALNLPPSSEFVAACLGALRHGVILVPLNPSDPVKRKTFIIQDAAVDSVLTDSAADQLPHDKTIVITADADSAGLDAVVPEPPAPDPSSLALVSYVSGSAGCADGVELTHGALDHAGRVLHQQFGLGPGDRVLLDTSIPLLFATLAAGAELVVPTSVEPLDVQLLLDTIRTAEITFLHLTPSVLHAATEHPDFTSCSSLRRVLSGGTALPTRLAQAFRGSLRAELVHDYGATEIAGPCLVHHARTDGPHEYLPIGRPVADTTALVLDERLRPVPMGITGDLHIGGPVLARGYHKRSELTARRFVDDPVHPGARLWRTGDLARWRPDGELVYVGRADDQVKVDGVRITPAEVDTALRRHVEVRKAATMVANEEFGALRLTSYVVLCKASLVNADDLRAHLRSWLPARLVTTEIVPVEEIPGTPDGAANRVTLRTTSTPRTEVGTDPHTPTEGLVQPLFASVLGLPDVGVTDNFFVLGGHSMMAMRLIAMVYETIGIELAVRDVFEAPTVTELATIIDTRRG